MDWSKFNEANKIGMALRAKPVAGVAALAGGLLAPAFISNDDRGYFASATITTPLIAAAFMASPGISNVIKEAAPKYSSYLKSVPDKIKGNKSITYEGLNAMRSEMSAGRVFPKQFNEAVGQFYAMQGNKTNNIQERIDSLRGNLAKTIDIPDGLGVKQRYLENVIHAESLRTLPSKELTAYLKQTKKSAVAPVIGMEGIQAMVEKQIANKNEPFIRAMGFHLQKMNGMDYSGSVTTATDDFDLPGIREAKNRFSGWEDIDAQLVLKNNRPDLFEAIQDQLNKGTFKPENVTIVNRNEAINSIVGIKINDLNIPVVGDNGRIRAGANWDKLGVSRGIFTSDTKYKSDVFAVKFLGLGSEQIEKDLSRANIINGADQTEEFSMFNPKSYESVSSGSELDTALRSMDYVASDITGFGKDGTTGFNKLSANAMEEQVGKLEQLGLIKSGSEKMSGVFQDAELSRASYYGLQNPSRQNPLTRAFTKDIRLGNVTNNPDTLPYAMSDLFKELVPNETLPIVGVREGGVTAAQRTFFAQLPNSVEDLHAYETDAIKMLMDRHSLGETEARSAWKGLSNWLSIPSNLQVMKKSEALAEGSKLLFGNLGGLNITRLHNFEVDEHALGDNPVNLVGSKLSDKTVIGFAGGNPITPKGEENFLENITELENGKYSLSIRENLALTKGSKIDLDAGTRGLIGEVGEEAEGAVYAQGLSLYNRAIGDDTIIHSQNRIFGLIGSEAAKGDPINATVNLSSSVLRSLSDMGQDDLVEKYSDLLGERGFTGGSTLMFDSKTFSRGGPTKSMYEFKKTQQVVNDLMDEATLRIRTLAINTPDKLNETGRNFAATNGATKLEDFLTRSEAPMNMTAWNSTAWNAPSEVKATVDILQDLHISGHHGAVRDILGRIEFDGDPSKTRQVAEYLNGDKSAITNKISLREAMGGKASRVKLGSAEGRGESIFNMDNEFAKDNYLLELPDGDSVPVLGHDAYGGRSNRKPDGGFSATDRERSLHDLAKGYEEGKTPEELSALKKAYIEGTETRTGVHDVLFGKNSFMRAPAVDPLAQGGFLQNRNSSLKLSSGEVNPFQFRVSVDYARRLKDKTLSEALLNGETITGGLARYPVSYVTMGEIVVDHSLQANEIAIDEGVTPLLRGDFDQDSGYVYPFQKGSEGEAEALAAIKEGSNQHKSLAILAEQEKSMFEELARNHGIDPKTLQDRLKRFTDDFSRTSDIHKQRLVSRTIGEFSNTRSIMMDMLEQSTTVTSFEDREALHHLFFQPYQSPISANKAKAGSEIALGGARNLNARLLEALDGSAPFTELKSAFINALQFAPDSVQEYTKNNIEKLEKFHAGITPEQYTAAKSKFASLEGKFAQVDLSASLRESSVLKYVGGAVRVEQEVSTGARMGAEAIGAINESISTAKNVSRAFKSSGAEKALAIGAGIATVAGLLTTTTSSPRARSANHYKPETTGSTGDHIPGEAVSGSYSSNPPKTRVSNEQPNVSRAVVAPISQNTDVEVNMKTDDPSRATEASKMIARSTGSGQTIVTNNYKTNNLTSLRNKQRLRERLDES